MYDVLYEGSAPPNSFDGLGVIESGVSQETLDARFDAGRLINDNFNIIVKVGGSTTYFMRTPPPDPAPEE